MGGSEGFQGTVNPLVRKINNNIKRQNLVVAIFSTIAYCLLGPVSNLCTAGITAYGAIWQHSAAWVTRLFTYAVRLYALLCIIKNVCVIIFLWG